MKKILLLFIAIILLAGVIGSFILKDIKSTQQQTQPEMPDITQSFPINEVTVSIPDTPTVALKNEFGPAVQVNNFLKKPDVVPDMQNQGVFFLGNTFDKSTSGGDSVYVITFTQDTTYFNVALLTEPLGTARLQAEAYLRNVLETSDSDLCALSYTVSVPDYVNKDFAGKDLRFSFCSGNVPLPLE